MAYPLGYSGEDRASVLIPGEHGSTFGGNPLACAAGYATLGFIIDNDIAWECQEVGILDKAFPRIVS